MRYGLATAGVIRALVLPACAQTQARVEQTVTIAPRSSAAVQARVIAPAQEAKLTDAQKLALLRQKVKYVFVLFQENRSFDFYFGTYPGADGLFSQPESKTPGFVQPIVNTDGTVGTITPFRIPSSLTDVNGKAVPLYPSDTDSVNHSHTAFLQKIDLQNGVTMNDGYALAEEGITLNAEGQPSRIPTQAQKQMGELVMGHVDCETAPVMWNYADRFTLFDNFHQTVLSASTPNAIAMVAGQVGQTQWVKHPEQSTKAYGGIQGTGVPVVNDGDPFWGSQLDYFGSGQPPSTGKRANPQVNLTFATLPLSFMGDEAGLLTAKDAQPQADLTDIEKDIKELTGSRQMPTNWGWYQQGYAREDADAAGAAPNVDYVAHHNAPQYFGYVSNNPEITPHLHRLTDFFNDVSARRLPASGGVFYVRGGYNNISGMKPLDPNPKLKTVFAGNDDHPGYADLQISGALLAQEVNAIANSPYWKDSAIIIAYDETDGLYDHAPEVVRDYDPYGEPLDQGPRIPAIVISPYSVVHGVAHEADEHSSIIRFIDDVFGLTPLADLPDEKEAREQGEKTLGIRYMGPADDGVPGVGNMFAAFSNSRLTGKAAPLPASYAVIPEKLYKALPQYGDRGCEVLQIVPTDHGRPNPVPVDFNPRPGSAPGVPTSGKWTP